MKGNGGDLPAGTLVTDRYGNLFMRGPQGDWNFAHFEDYVPTLASDGYAPYIIIYTPKETS